MPAMTTNKSQLDKSVDTPMGEGYGSIAIRVVVLEKHLASAAQHSEADDAPVDAGSDESLPDTDKRPTSSFLEEPKRGRQVCVFLINGQRQHAWDNQFIVRDLELKYLRLRMLVIVDCDGLNPEAIADLMQGSRNQFYEGRVYAALESRLLATLKGDPDLRRLEEEAEDDISSLKAGDEAVKAALDQLIESHHEAATHVGHGHGESGDANRQEGLQGGLTQTQNVVKLEPPVKGSPASGPVLQLRPDVVTIRLKPNEERSYLIYPLPDGAWKALEGMGVTFDPPVKELHVTRSPQLDGEEVVLKFAEPDEFDEDEYPIETTMRAAARFAGHEETRLIERRLVVTPGKNRVRNPPKPLLDDPTFVKVTSRQPIKLVLGGADVHVKLRWDGKDELVTDNPPIWSFRVSCDSPSVEPPTFLTRAVDGRFELLIQSAAGLKAGDQLRFDVEAMGPGKTLATAFLADVVEPMAARKTSVKLPGGGQRRPPYELKYLTKDNWVDGDLSCFDQPWTGAEPGSFDEPSAKSPLTIFINQDTDLLVSYRDALLAKKLAETTISQRINKYTTHIAFHLYQIYLRTKNRRGQAIPDGEVPSETMMREEIQRVANTLIQLMQVAQ